MATFLSGIGAAAASLGEYVTGLVRPNLRIGVTGLSRAGKTVFLTALVHALVGGGRLPVFRPLADGRLIRARLAPQPDDAVPRFAYEDHLATLTGPDRAWPESTRRIAELRIEIEYQPVRGMITGALFGGPASLTLDIVDYPGEWLLDLPLLETSYADWSRQTIAAARTGSRAKPFAAFLDLLQAVDPKAPASETLARDLAEAFRAALIACREESIGLSSLPPGRFLMPGDLEGSPALTFAPLDFEGDAPSGSLRASMERRFESYKSRVVQPFFADHFARLDRQIVLVDLLSALNAGTEALADLEQALSGVLAAFRVGENSLFTSMFSPRIERVMFAATKADHLRHENHDRLEAILSVLLRRAVARVRGEGAALDILALAAVRATREVTARGSDGPLPCIAGIPLAGEWFEGSVYDGLQEVALFPGDLPADPDAVFRPGGIPPLRHLRFRPPPPQRGPDGMLSLPHIRLDRALQFLLGDRLA